MSMSGPSLAALLTVLAPSHDGPRYFPPSLATPSINCPYAVRRQAIMDDFRNNWYSGQLRAAGEPSLYQASLRPRAAGAETLRFTWLPTFHHPVIVRLETERESVRLVARELSGAGGYDPGRVAREVNRPLSPAEGRALRATLQRTRLFAASPDTCRFGTDGSQWIFERVDAGGYRFADHWSPENGPARELGSFLLGLTGWRFEHIY